MGGPAPAGGGSSGGGASPAATGSILPAIAIGAAAAIAVLAVTWSWPSSERPASQPIVSATVGAPSAPVALVATAAPAQSSALAPAAKSAGPTPSGSPAASATASAAVDDEEDEAVLLGRAQAAIAANPNHALELAGEHATRFPKGVLAQEREVIAIAALVGLGRSADARARAEAFLTRFPKSAHRGRIAVLVPGIEIDAGDHKAAPPSPPTGEP